MVGVVERVKAINAAAAAVAASSGEKPGQGRCYD